MEIFKLFGSILVDNDKANESIKKTGTEAEKSGSLLSELGGIAKKIGAVVAGAFTIKAIVDFGKNCINATEALELVQRKTQTIFGDMTSDVEEWALANERTFGLGSGTIQGYLNNIADITQGMGMAKDASLEMAKGAMELGAQLANWNDIGADQAMSDLQSAITGSTKAVEKYGIKLNDNVLSQTAMNMGLGDSFSALDEATKAQVRYQAIIDASGNAIEFWNEGNRSSSFYLTEMKEQFGNVCEVIGGWFLPIYQEATKLMADGAAQVAILVSNLESGLNEANAKFSETGDLVDWLSTFFQEVFGIDMPEQLGIFASGLQDVWESVIQPTINMFSSIVQDLWDLWLMVAPDVERLFSEAGQMISDVWNSFIKTVFDIFIDLVGLVADAFQERMPAIASFFKTMVDDVVGLWNNNLKPMFDAIKNFIENVLAPSFRFVFENIILPIVDACFKGIMDLWSNSLKPILTGIIDFITGVFSGNWTQAWKGIANIFDGIFGGLISIAKTPINAIIGMINKLIGGLNKIKLPDWVPGLGGKGINIPTIPMLYKGTDYFKPTKAWGNMALVGERGPELVELPTGSRVNTADETRNLLSGNSGGVFIFQSILDGKVVAETTAQYSDIVNGSRLNLTERGLIL